MSDRLTKRLRRWWRNLNRYPMPSAVLICAELSPRERSRTSEENVCDVLDALERLQRRGEPWAVEHREPAWPAVSPSPAGTP